MKPLSKGFFVVQSNTSQQFNYFKTLVKWLFSLNDIKIQDFSKYDDPMTVSTNIQSECKKLNIKCQYSPIKLKSGFGEQVIILINELVTRALVVKKFTFKNPKLQQKTEMYNFITRQQVEVIDKEEQQPDAANQQIQESCEMEEEGAKFAFKAEQNLLTRMDQDRQFIDPKINEKNWNLQCQKVANKLKIVSKPDAKEWRNHIDSTKQYQQVVKTNFPWTRANLQKLNQQLTKTLQKIGKSQKNINNSMSDLGSDYKDQTQNLKMLKITYNNRNSSIKEMNQQYRQIGEQLETILKKTDQQGNTMADNSPVVKIKAALQKIQAELKTMDVRIGVLSHSLMNHRNSQRHKDQQQGGNILDDFYE